jgi:hypothetical protein
MLYADYSLMSKIQPKDDCQGRADDGGSKHLWNIR